MVFQGLELNLAQVAHKISASTGNWTLKRNQQKFYKSLKLTLNRPGVSLMVPVKEPQVYVVPVLYYS